MKTAVRLGCLVLAMSVIGATRVEANIWDWLEDLNGPGPARSRGNFTVNVVCREKEDVTEKERSGPRLGRLFATPTNGIAAAANRASCFFVDFRRLHAEEDSRFYPVNVSITEFGASAWVHPAVEIGAGVGVMHFSSEDPTTEQRFSGNRMTISFPRLVFKPLLAAPIKALQQHADLGFFQVYFKESIIVGDSTQADFASKPGTEFDRRHQRVESMGFIIDVPLAAQFLNRVLTR